MRIGWIHIERASWLAGIVGVCLVVGGFLLARVSGHPIAAVAGTSTATSTTTAPPPPASTVTVTTTAPATSLLGHGIDTVGDLTQHGDGPEESDWQFTGGLNLSGDTVNDAISEDYGGAPMTATFLVERKYLAVRGVFGLLPDQTDCSPARMWLTDQVGRTIGKQSTATADRAAHFNLPIDQARSIVFHMSWTADYGCSVGLGDLAFVRR